MNSFLQEFKQSMRVLRQNPSFTITALTVITLGIATNTAIFSVVNTTLLRPLRAPDPDRVVAIVSTSQQGASSAASEIKFNLWRDQTNVLQDMSAYYYISLTLTGVDRPLQADAIHITRDYFRLFGLPVAQGRTFSAEEEQAGGDHVVVLSDAFWKRAFGADPKMVGKVISFGDGSYQVIGIMAKGVETETPEPPDVWLPFPIDVNSTNQVHYFFAAGRIKPGVTIEAANAQLQVTTEEFYRRYPKSLSTNRKDRFSAQPLGDVLVKDVRQSLLVLTAAVSLVLLIACANVANLLLARAAGRRREIAVRIALGASRARIVRQLLMESLSLSIVGGILGLGVGVLSIRAVLALNPIDIPRIGLKGANVTMDWRVVAFAILLTVVTALLFGLIPALQTARSDVQAGLKEGAGRAVSGFRQSRIRGALVVGEISLALLLLIGAALLIRTLVALRSVNPGFDGHNVFATRTPLEPKLVRAETANQIATDVFRRLSALPGVERAGYTRMLPLDGGFNSLPIVIAGRPLSGPAHGNTRWMIVSPEYFSVLKIPVLRGRSFTDADRLDAPLVAVINQAMARQFWPDGDPVGAELFIGKGLGPDFAEPARQVVGIVGDVLDNGLGAPPPPAVFVPGAQLSDRRTAGRAVTWVIRTRAYPGPLKAELQEQIRQATGQPVPPLRSMEEVAGKSMARQDFNLLLMGIFGGSALLLAALGIYGLMAYAAEQRANEMGIRMALGATQSDVRNLMTIEGMRFAAAGIVIGVLAAAGLSRYLESFLFGVKALDPLVFVVIPALLGLVSLAAVWIPAFRASRVDLLSALRNE
jgi:putative ABC transport system permease protein